MPVSQRSSGEIPPGEVGPSCPDQHDVAGSDLGSSLGQVLGRDVVVGLDRREIDEHCLATRAVEEDCLGGFPIGVVVLGEVDM